MNILYSKEPSYVRCIKPNYEKKSNYFDIELVKHQVKYLSLMENLRVRRAGYAYRKPYEQFLDRYKCLCPKTWPNFNGDPIEGAQSICEHLKYELDKDYCMGRSKIFIRSSKIFFNLEDLFYLKKLVLANKIKALYRCYKEKKKYKKIQNAAKIITRNAQLWLARKRVEKIKQAKISLKKY